MNQKQFIIKLSKLYQEAEFTKFPGKDNKIIRGTNHPVSHLLEDLFAFFLYKNLPKRYNFLIDYTISIQNYKSIRPDIIIWHKEKNVDVIDHLIDVKTNIGFMRDEFAKKTRFGNNYCKQKHFEIKKLIGKKGFIRDPNNRKLKLVFLFNPRIKYHIVIAMGRNISKQKLSDNLRKAKKYSNLKTYVLIQNDVTIKGNIVKGKRMSIQRILKNAIINKKDFVDLLSNLRR